MDRRLYTVVLALAAGIPQSAFAQTRMVVAPLPVAAVPVAPIGAALKLAPGMAGAPALRLPTVGVSPTLAPVAGVRLSPAAAPLALPAAAPGGAVAAGRVAAGRGAIAPRHAGSGVAPAGAKAGAAAQAVTARGSLGNLAATVAPKDAAAAPAAALDGLRRFFDAGAGAAADEIGAMSFSGYLDPRVSNALEALGRTAVGLSVYREIYNKYGGTLQLRVDSDPNASYDTRLVWEGGNPVIQLSDKLVRRESREFVASFIAREMAQLYYGSFPESVERDYLAHSVLVRSYAEMTNSDIRGGWWDTRRDRWQNGRYAMQSYYGSWKEAVNDYFRRGGRIQDSPFFRFLQGSNGRTLEQLYHSGSINYQTYGQMSDYFRQIAQSEVDWIGSTGR